jgi:hypothetical protein
VADPIGFEPTTSAFGAYPERFCQAFSFYAIAL